MKFKISAGAEVDVLTKDELKDVVQKQLKVLTSGVNYRWVQPANNPTPAVAGALSFTFTPQDGYIWDVETISVLKDGTGVVRVSINEDTPSRFWAHIADDGNNGNTLLVSSKSLVVPAGSTLLVKTIGAFSGKGSAQILVKETLSLEQWRL